MAYATAADLCSFMQVPSVDTATADLILQCVADGMDDWAGQPLAQQDVTALLIDGTGAAEFVLPGFPVNSVTSIETLGDDATWTLLTSGVDYAWSSSGVVERRWKNGNSRTRIVPPWPSAKASIRASYNRGRGGVSKSLQFVNLSAAARLMANPLSLISEQVGGMQLRYSAKESGPMFTGLELGILGRVSDPAIA